MRPYFILFYPVRYTDPKSWKITLLFSWNYSMSSWIWPNSILQTPFLQFVKSWRKIHPSLLLYKRIILLLLIAFLKVFLTMNKIKNNRNKMNKLWKRNKCNRNKEKNYFKCSRNKSYFNSLTRIKYTIIFLIKVWRKVINQRIEIMCLLSHGFHHWKQ